MIQNDTNTSSQPESTSNGARTLVSKPKAAQALVLLLALGLVAGCGDDGGAPSFPADAGADAAPDSGGSSTNTGSNDVSTTAVGPNSTTNTSTAVTTAETIPGSTSEDTTAEVDSGPTDTSSSDDSTSSVDTSVTDTNVSVTDTGSSLTTDVSSTDPGSSWTDSSDTTTSGDSTDSASVSLDLDAGADADANTTDPTETDPDSSVTDSGDGSTDPVTTDPTETSETSEDPDAADTAVETDGSVDAGEPVMLSGIGPIFPDPGVDYALPTGTGLGDAYFTATLTAPISKLVLTNTDENGDPYLIPNAGPNAYSYWTTSNPIPSAVPDITADTDYNIHTLNNSNDVAVPIPLLGTTNEVTLDMYVTYDPTWVLPPYHRLYVFGENGELTQIVDFTAPQDSGADAN